ncbi:MAG: zf-HC2 domain-containing protein [Gammaproteobacteria bacterium]
MNSIADSSREKHQEIRRLLPWYVNGTLEKSETERIESHLDACHGCREEVLDLKKIASFVSHADSLASAEQPSFSALERRIREVQPGARVDPKKIFFLPLLLKKNRGEGTSRSALFARAAVVFIAVGLAVIADFRAFAPIQVNPFHTLSSSKRVASGADQIRLVFAAGVKRDQIVRIVASVHGEIVRGPDTVGVYIVRIDADTIARRDLGKVLETLRANKQIVFAEPALSAPPLNPSGDG